MKKMVLVFALAAIALSSVSAFAIDPHYSDNIGIYVDEAATDNCAMLPLGAASGYLVLTKATATDVRGWEAKFTTTANLALTGVLFRGVGPINAATKQGEYIVGLAAPMPTVGGTAVLADISLWVIDGNPAGLFVDEVYFSTLEDGMPAYLDADLNGISLHPVRGEIVDPIFLVNDVNCAVVGVEESTFGAVKSLFR